jgi:hypothetical protein
MRCQTLSSLSCSSPASLFPFLHLTSLICQVVIQTLPPRPPGSPLLSVSMATPWVQVTSAPPYLDSPGSAFAFFPPINYMENINQLHMCLYSWTSHKEEMEVTQLGWMNKMWSLHAAEYYSAFKRKEILAHAPIWMNLEKLC